MFVNNLAETEYFLVNIIEIIFRFWILKWKFFSNFMNTFPWLFFISHM